MDFVKVLFASTLILSLIVGFNFALWRLYEFAAVGFLDAPSVDWGWFAFCFILSVLVIRGFASIVKRVNHA